MAPAEARSFDKAFETELVAVRAAGLSHVVDAAVPGVSGLAVQLQPLDEQELHERSEGLGKALENSVWQGCKVRGGVRGEGM